MSTSEWLSPQEVGQLAGGFSASFIRSEIKAGQLSATYYCSARGRVGRWRVRRADAIAYAEKLARDRTATTATTATDDTTI